MHFITDLGSLCLSFLMNHKSNQQRYFLLRVKGVRTGLIFGKTCSLDNTIPL